MSWRVYSAAIVVVLLLLIGPFREAHSSRTWTNLVLVGWDGVQRTHLDDALAAGRLPVLAELIATGTRADLIIADHSRTTTGPCVYGWGARASGWTSR